MTAPSRRVERPGRSFGRQKRVLHRPGRTTVSRTARLENAGPVIFLLLLAIGAVGATIGWFAIGGG